MQLLGGRQKEHARKIKKSKCEKIQKSRCNDKKVPPNNAKRVKKQDYIISPSDPDKKPIRVVVVY